MNKKRLLCLGLFTVLTIGTAASTFAMGYGNHHNYSSRGCSSSGSMHRYNKHSIMNTVLVNDYDITQEDIDQAYLNGDSLWDILESNDIDSTDFRKACLNYRISEVDKALEDGTITETQRDRIKENLLLQIENCDNYSNSTWRGNGHRGGRGGC